MDQVQGNFEAVESDQVQMHFSMRIGIDACDDGCIRFRENRSRRIVRDGSGNLWVRFRGNNSTTIERDRSGCWKKFRGDSSSGGCWNRCRVRDMCTPSSLVPDGEVWCSSVRFLVSVFASPNFLLPVLVLFSVSIGLPCFFISVFNSFLSLLLPFSVSLKF